MEQVFSTRPERTQMRDQVFIAIRDAIVSLRLEPGQRLTEASLAEQLGVSKTPIREALLRLEQLGFVTTEKYKGAVVRGYDRSDLIELYELRELLEGACAREAAGSVAPEELAELQRILTRSEQAHEDGDVDEVARLFDEFDEILMRQTDNTRISGLLEMLGHHMIRIGSLTVTIPGRIEDSLNEHQAIVEAISKGDEEAAEQQMRKHVRSVLDSHLADKDELLPTRD